jgi:hypothetical protein
MNKKLLLTSMFSTLMIISCDSTVNYENVGSSGKFMPGGDNKLNGNAYVLADDKYMDLVQTSTDAYNAKDWDAMKALYTDDFVEWGKESMPKYFEEIDSLDMDIFAMVPVHLKGDDKKMVFTWSTETRKWKNGSKERVQLFEIYNINDDDKLMGWNQWTNKVSNPAFTDHGLSSGGKFIGQDEGNENSGKPFVFSNRGEVEVMEKFFEAANNMDVEGFMNFVTDPFTFNGQELSSKDVKELFAARESQEWKPWAMLPIKIGDTDPASGVIVYSTAEVKGKDGDSWKAELSETYYFDLNGKISSVSQYSRSVPGTEPGSE